jgi:DNA relaxase NicK
MGTKPSIVIRLDYLAASVFHDPEDFGKRLAAHLGGAVRMSRPRNGYQSGYAVEVQEEVQAEFHLRAKDPIWTFATGGKSQALWDFLTEGGFDWYVTRHDAALDVFDPQWFPILVAQARQYAHENGVATGVAGDWISPHKGRTFYLGARSSRFFHRIYEKGRKERTDPAWIRCELEHKPQLYPDRIAATKLTAAQLWAMHAGPIFGATLGLDLAEVFDLPTRPHRVKRDHERSRRALASQYGRTIGTWLQECGGDPSAFVAELMASVEHQAAVRRWDAAPPARLVELEDPQ